MTARQCPAVLRWLAALCGDVMDRVTPMRPEVQAGIAAAEPVYIGELPNELIRAARAAAAAEMFPQHAKVSAPGSRSPVVADRPGPQPLDEGAHSRGPGHSTSAAPDAADGPDPATPRTAGSGHPHTSSPAGTTKPLPGDAAATGRTGPQLSTSDLLYEAAGALRCLTERHERVTSLIDELRDRAAQFAAAGD